jgi:hypothetical protein
VRVSSTKLYPSLSLLGSSNKSFYSTAGTSCLSVANMISIICFRIVLCNWSTIPRNYAILKWMSLYCKTSLFLQPTCPSLVVLNAIFMPYALKSNIHCIGLAVPRTMNESIIFITYRKLLLVRLLRAGRRICSLSYPLSSNVYRLSIAAYSSSPIWPVNLSAYKITIKCATLMMDDRIDGNVCSSLNPLLVGRTPNTANAQTNAISVSRCYIV